MKKWLTGRRIAIVFFVIAVVLAVGLIKPAVPTEISLFTGPEGSTFYQYGLRYQEVLARHGVTVHVETTRDSLDNLTHLMETQTPTAAIVDAVQISSNTKTDKPKNISSLGTLSVQPIWVFGRRDADIGSLQDLRGRRILSGQQGSGARVLALVLLEATGIDDQVDIASGVDTPPADLPAAMEANSVGAVIVAGEPGSPLVDTLLRSPALEVVDVPRSEAIALNYRVLKQVRLPEGAHDLKANIPNRDLTLLASGTELLVSDPFPPALADLLLEAATEIHGQATLFSKSGQFPSQEVASMPLSGAAKHYYTDGPSALREYLPFRLATLVDRFLLVAVAIASAAVGLFSILPRLLSLPFKVKVGRAYRRLAEVEKSMSTGADRDALRAELAELDRETAEIRVPMRSLMATWFDLRQFTHDMRDRFEAD